jgi:peroxiredoxin Q/BCP
MLNPGDQAPDFTLPDQHDNAVTLSDFKGTTVVLYFYAKADTLGPGSSNS